nr:hypothetical protein [Tanacetum cinerariifolium]
DDEDDEMDIEADEEEEEHPTPVDSVVVAPTTADQAPSAEETEPFETDESAATPPPHPAYHIGSPRVDDNEYLMMLDDPYVDVALQAPPSPVYMPGPEEPEQAPPSPDYIPGPEHADDEIVAEDQHLHQIIS